MSKVQLQKDIRNNGGFILSDGTCNLQHLLPKAYDLINTYNLRNGRCGIGDLKTSIIECFRNKENKQPNIGKTSNMMFLAQYYGEISLVDYRHGDIQLDPSHVWDDCENFFNSLAPNGYYFGSSEGDGACIGWFKYEE